MVRGLRRWLVFNAVGTMGVGVQLAVLLSLTEGLGLNYLVSTVLAVESAILHNFVWHEHWTWRDRSPGTRGRWTRLAWFNLVTGALSISSNVVFTALYVSTFGVHYAIANLDGHRDVLVADVRRERPPRFSRIPRSPWQEPRVAPRAPERRRHDD